MKIQYRLRGNSYPHIIISEDAKEEFIKLMDWDEELFEEWTIKKEVKESE